jgi:hypothetical protein
MAKNTVHDGEENRRMFVFACGWAWGGGGGWTVKKLIWQFDALHCVKLDINVHVLYNTSVMQDARIFNFMYVVLTPFMI